MPSACRLPQDAACHHRIDDEKRLVIRGFVSPMSMGRWVEAVNALRSQLGMLDRRMVKLLIVVTRRSKSLCICLTGSIATQ
ncbi:MAG: hypothetical protein ACLSHA_10785 [Neglectibacter timonensis]